MNKTYLKSLLAALAICAFAPAQATDFTNSIGEELIQAAQEMKANQRACVTKANDVMITRQRLGLSQVAFARMLGISPRTIQEWEQGRRSPQGAALSLIAHRPG